MIFASLGFVCASVLPRERFWPVWIAVVLVCELGLSVTVCDSLAIDCILLVHPVEAIRVWRASR